MEICLPPAPPLDQNPIPDRIVREPERRHITGISPVQWWRYEKAGLAPRRLKLGPNSVGWKLSALQRWISEREAA